MVKTRKFIYRTHLRWLGEKKGRLSAEGKPPIEFATPPEFRGHKGMWTPEELFVASVNCCIMTTFLYYAEKEKLKLQGFESSSVGILERGARGLIFSTVELTPRISLARAEDTGKAKDLLERAERNCLISNSIKSKVVIYPEIKVTGREVK